MGEAISGAFPGPCPKCGETVKPDWVACPACGARLKASCSQCGSALRPEWKVCPHCGGAPQAA
jgi:uncharacterized OB-fold protein